MTGALLNIVDTGPDYDAEGDVPADDDDEADDLHPETDRLHKNELASVIWILSVATSGNLLTIPGEATPVFARNLMQVSDRADLCLSGEGSSEQ